MVRYLVTSALPYANGYVHLGHLAGAYLPADIYTRLLRLYGTDVVFISGSDEHGVPITLRADNEDITARNVIDHYHPANEAAFEGARIQFDIYGRTSDEEHGRNVQQFFHLLESEGHIEQAKIRQWYSEKKGQFLPDRYVEGVCPICTSDGARGDQCDNCGQTYEALELGEPIVSRLPGDGSAPIVRETWHWFLRLNDFQEQIERWSQQWKD